MPSDSGGGRADSLLIKQRRLWWPIEPGLVRPLGVVADHGPHPMTNINLRSATGNSDVDCGRGDKLALIK